MKEFVTPIKQSQKNAIFATVAMAIVIAIKANAKGMDSDITLLDFLDRAKWVLLVTYILATAYVMYKYNERDLG